MYVWGPCSIVLGGGGGGGALGPSAMVTVNPPSIVDILWDLEKLV